MYKRQTWAVALHHRLTPPVCKEAQRVAAISLVESFLARHPEFERFGPAWNQLFYHSAVVARTASNLATLRQLPGAERAFVGGMLHDVGRTVALRAVALLTLDGALALELGSPRLERLLDQVHLELGGELHQEWQMPQYLTVLAVRHHDQAIPAEPEFLDLHVVRLAAAVYDLKAEPASAWRAAGELEALGADEPGA